MALLKLYFKNCQGKERLIAECETVQEIHKGINKFLDEHEYISHYSRSWGNEESIIIDVGSHSEFFVIKGISHIDYIKALQKNVEQEEQSRQITMDEYLEGLKNS